MKKRMFWGLGVLVLLIGIVGVFVLIQQDTDTNSDIVLGEATKKLLKDRKKQTTVKPEVLDANRPPPLGETHETGHWDGDIWHRTAMPETSVNTRENVLNMPGVISSLTSDQVKVWKVLQQEREAKLRELAAGQPKRESHPHDVLSPEKHQRLHADVKALAVENDLSISDAEKMLDDLKSGRYKDMSIEEVKKRIQNMELRVNALKKRYNSQK